MLPFRTIFRAISLSALCTSLHRGGKIALTRLQHRKTSFDQLTFLIDLIYPQFQNDFWKQLGQFCGLFGKAKSLKITFGLQSNYTKLNGPQPLEKSSLQNATFRYFCPNYCYPSVLSYWRRASDNQFWSCLCWCLRAKKYLHSGGFLIKILIVNLNLRRKQEVLINQKRPMIRFSSFCARVVMFACSAFRFLWIWSSQLFVRHSTICSTVNLVFGGGDVMCKISYLIAWWLLATHWAKDRELLDPHSFQLAPSPNTFNCQNIAVWILMCYHNLQIFETDSNMLSQFALSRAQILQIPHDRTLHQ